MRLLPPLPAAILLAAGLVLSSCAGPHRPATATATTTTTTAAAVPAKAKFSPFPKMPAFSLAGLLPGSRVKVVQVRQKDLKKLPTGRERALAYESTHRRGFGWFSGPVDFKEPMLPEPGSELDGSLLPPRIP